MSAAASGKAGAGLPVPTTPEGRTGLAALVSAPERSLIALDFDGTLAPIVADPTAARPEPGAVEALRRLAPDVGTIAVISGRPAMDAIEYGRLHLIPGLIVLGHYGRERWQNGTLTRPPSQPGVEAARRELPSVLARARAPEGIWTEDKGEAVAIHTRRTARPREALEQLREPLANLAERTGLRMEPGRFVIELRPAGTDKGSTLANLASESEPSSILFCGDDLGDAPAFARIREFRAAGTPGLAVWSQSAEVARLGEEADLIVDGPPGVVALMQALAGVLARK
jgi:trehalose 6-phosphate phosphatase